MADITVTAANVVAGTGAKKNEGTAGGTITAGMPVYKDAADSDKLKACDADDGAAKAAAVGIALHGASSGQPLIYQEKGPITIGGTVVVGEIYVVSGNVGGIAPRGDLGVGDFTTVLGVGLTTGSIQLNILASGVQLAS